jgi:hypothetical protein
MGKRKKFTLFVDSFHEVTLLTLVQVESFLPVVGAALGLSISPLKSRHRKVIAFWALMREYRYGEIRITYYDTIRT